MRKKSLLIAFLLFLFVSNIFVNAREIKISLKKIRDIGFEKGSEIYRWVDIAFDENNNLYVTDMMDYSVKKYSFEGKFIKKTGRRGRGPGEFYSPGLITYAKNKIYVTQQMFPWIQVFDKDLKYKYTIKIKIPIMDIRVSKNGEIFMLSTGISGNNILKIEDFNKGNLKLSISDNKMKGSWLDIGKFAIDNKNNIIKVFSGKNKIIKYDKYGKILWKTTIPFLRGEAEKLKPKGKIPFMMFSKFLFKGIALDTDGLIYILGGHYCESKEIYVLDKNGKYLKTLKLDESSHTIKIRNNFLFTRGNEGESISVYKIIKK